MEANQIAFGVEVETHLPANDATPIGTYYNAKQTPWLPQGWNCGHDGSIRAPGSRRKAEFASPILRGETGLKETHEAVAKIRDRGAGVNESCGVHVTITFPANNGAALARLVCLFAHYEDGLYGSTGSPRRRQGTFAKSIKRHGAGRTGNKAKAEAASSEARRDRFHALNLTHIARGKNRVEFRLFSGSTNPDKIVAWVRLVLAIAEYALKSSRAVGFDDRSKDTRFGGPATRSLTQLLCRLGWLTWKAWGYDGHRYGNVQAEGLPTLDDSAKLLRSLAEKYDNR